MPKHTLEEIIRKHGDKIMPEHLIEALKELANDLRTMESARFQVFLDSFVAHTETQNEISNKQNRLLEVLSEIKDKKSPEYPEIIFPEIQRVLIENQQQEISIAPPTWLDAVKFNLNSFLSGLKNLFINTILSAKLEKGSADKPQYVILVDRNGNEIDLSKFLQTPTLGASKIIRKGGNPSRIIGETPVGNIDGSNTIFTLAYTPVNDHTGKTTLRLHFGGSRLSPTGVDYSLAGKTITFNTAPPSGSGPIVADYETTAV